LACVLYTPSRSFDFVDRKLIAELVSLRFLDDTTYVLLIGPPGVGNPDVAERLVLGERTVLRSQCGGHHRR